MQCLLSLRWPLTAFFKSINRELRLIAFISFRSINTAQRDLRVFLMVGRRTRGGTYHLNNSFEQIIRFDRSLIPSFARSWGSRRSSSIPQINFT